MSGLNVLVQISSRYLERVDELKAKAKSHDWSLDQWLPSYKELRDEYVDLFVPNRSSYIRQEIDRFLTDGAYSVSVYKVPSEVAAWDIAQAVDRMG